MTGPHLFEHLVTRLVVVDEDELSDGPEVVEQLCQVEPQLVRAHCDLLCQLTGAYTRPLLSSTQAVLLLKMYPKRPLQPEHPTNTP